MIENEQLKNNIRKLTKKLRKEYYINSKSQNHCDLTPFGGSIRESIGPFPEFILKGRFCKRSIKGLCTPCFYSRLPEHTISDEWFNKGYLSQVDFIVENFDEIVLKNQIGKIACCNYKKEPIYGLVCTPTGSYFDNDEYPIEIRKQNLKKLINIAKDKNCELALHIETHVEDVLQYFSNPDIEELKLLACLNTRIILGFESSNDFSRNILYGKNLSIEDFEKAVNIIKFNGFPVGAFVFAGLFAYNDYETIIDVKETLIYLKETGVSPVIMFANTQKYTIPDVLMFGEKYKLLDSHTVLEVTKMVIDIYGCNMDNNIDPWFIADPKGGPPDPNMHIFNSVHNTACNDCSKKIYGAIEELRITKDETVFLENYRHLKKCSCFDNYKKNIIKNKFDSENIDLNTRLIERVSYVEKQMPYYILRENPWIVKAELLCYGLYLNQEQRKIVLEQNPFAEEKGLVDAVHINYCNIYINICIAEKFCDFSPYTAEYDYSGKKWLLKKDNIYIGDFVFLPMPDWTLETVGGKPAGSIIRPHNEKCLSLWPSTECIYVRNGVGCAFCGLNSTKSGNIIDKKIVVDAIKKALLYNTNYEINISGGTCGSPDKAILYLSEICTQIKLLNDEIAISVECAPPSENYLIDKLYSSGATALIMNIEIFDDGLRKEICPGKANIPIERYFEALKYAVTVYGKGNVSSVLIMGLQPIDDIKLACERLTDIGVIPTIMPFKPLDNTKLENYPVPNPRDYIEISKYVASTMLKKGLKINECSGCASCGACSLEINLT